MAVVGFTEFMDVQFARSIAAQDVGRRIDSETGKHANDYFDAKDFENKRRLHLFGNHDGKHFVGRCQKDRNERAQGNNAACIQRCRRGRKATLGEGAEQGANERPCVPCAFYRFGRLVARSTLERFHGQVGHKQEGHELRRVDEGVEHYV